MRNKLLSVFLALALLVSCFAVTASATEITEDEATAKSMVCYNLHG